MKKLFAILLLVIPFSVKAQNISRGYKLLEKMDYEKAEDIFSESYASEENKTSSGFALALIYADDRSPYYDLVRAWDYATKIKPEIKKLTAEEIEIIGEYFLNTEERRSSRPVTTKIEYAVETIEAKLIKHVREENDLSLVYKVLESYPDFRYYDNVIHIRNYLEFRKYEKMNTIDGYEEFISKFPDAAQVEKAGQYIRTLELEAILNSNSTDKLKSFIAKYPGTAEYNTALKKLHSVAFAQARQKNSFAALEDFIRDYPDALETAEAREILMQLLYENAKKIKTLEAYNEFIKKYPEGEFFIDIFNLKSSDLGAKFLAGSADIPVTFEWARGFEDPSMEITNVLLAVDENDGYVICSSFRNIPDDKKDVWVLKTDSTGNMLWNRRIGEGLNMNVKLLANGINNEIIGCGESWIQENDSLKTPRLFKLDASGKKIWSKELNMIHPEAMICTRSGNIVTGGFMSPDSLKICGIAITGPDGREIISRAFSVSDTIHTILETGEGHLIISGSTWMAEIDAKGQIIRESFYPDSIRVSSLVFVNQKSVLGSATRDGNVIVLMRDLASGNISENKVNSRNAGIIITGKKSEQFALSDGEEEGTDIMFLNSNRTEKHSVFMPYLYNADFETDGSGNLILCGINNGRIILIRNSGFFF